VEIMNKVIISVALLVPLAGCAVGVDDFAEDVAEAADELGQPSVCPAIAITCAWGYSPKALPNCHQICVPNQGFECLTDLDCGPIQCITEPCDQPVCRGRQCVVAHEPPAKPGETCGDITCGAGMYCCNASCGLCAPEGGACIQIACL
jgi:hypothetical protein